jgi:chromosome segregation ATPase
VTTDERIENLLKATERLESTATRQAEEMKDIAASFREFREDRWHINQSLRTLIENVNRMSASVDALTENVNKLESLFNRSLTNPPNGKTKD